MGATRGYEAWHGRRTGALLWRFEAGPGQQRVLPDGVMDLMWWRGRFQFAGADTTAMLFPSAEPVVTWGLRLPPGAAYALLGVPARELTDRRVDLAELTHVPTAIVDTAPADPAAALEAMATTLWRRARPEPPRLRMAASLDRAARAGRGVGEIAAEHNLSERSLRRLSDRVFGYGPKSLSAIHRFQRALFLARSGSPLGEASVGAGYVDQSHLNREARRLAGTTPTRLLD